jgi:hypothetical protein
VYLARADSVRSVLKDVIANIFDRTFTAIPIEKLVVGHWLPRRSGVTYQ